MTMNLPEGHRAPEPSVIPALLAQRATLQEWLDRLEAEGGGANPRVVERVRADYSQRLRLVLDELGQHHEGLRRQRATLAESLAEADFRADQAAEELEEARLRHRIGELGEDDWSERRPALEDAVATMAERRDEVRAELARLDEILRQVEVETAPTREPDAVALAPEPEPDPVTEWGLEPDAEPAAPADAGLAPAAAVEPDLAADPDRNFLEQLDRAMSEGYAAEPEPEPEPRAKTGVRCKECGYTNDAGAWYCGVCGVDLQ